MSIKINRVKTTTALHKYGWIRERGFRVRGADGNIVVLRGDSLDKWIDEQIWRQEHPGEEPESNLDPNLNVIQEI